MALSESGLASGIESAFSANAALTWDIESESAKAAARLQAATNLADAYADYAENGEFNASAPVVSSAMRSALASAINAGLDDSGSLSAFGSALQTGIAAFWTGASVTGPQTGTTNGCPGATSIGAAIAALAGTDRSYSAGAAAVASILHTATATVTATVTPPVTPPEVVLIA